jgi:hypothetical protein
MAEESKKREVQQLEVARAVMKHFELRASDDAGSDVLGRAGQVGQVWQVLDLASLLESAGGDAHHLQAYMRQIARSQAQEAGVDEEAEIVEANIIGGGLLVIRAPDEKSLALLVTAERQQARRSISEAFVLFWKPRERGGRGGGGGGESHVHSRWPGVWVTARDVFDMYFRHGVGSGLVPRLQEFDADAREFRSVDEVSSTSFAVSIRPVSPVSQCP